MLNIITFWQSDFRLDVIELKVKWIYIHTQMHHARGTHKTNHCTELCNEIVEFCLFNMQAAQQSRAEQGRTIHIQIIFVSNAICVTAVRCSVSSSAVNHNQNVLTDAHAVSDAKFSTSTRCMPSHTALRTVHEELFQLNVIT